MRGFKRLILTLRTHGSVKTKDYQSIQDHFDKHACLLMSPILHSNTLYWVTKAKEDQIGVQLLDDLLDSVLLCYPEAPVYCQERDTCFHAAAYHDSAKKFNLIQKDLNSRAQTDVVRDMKKLIDPRRSKNKEDYKKLGEKSMTINPNKFAIYGDYRTILEVQ